MIPKGPLKIPKLPRPASGTWRVPGSKSITNRALVLAALAEGRSELYGVLESDDTRHMRFALESLGVSVHALDATTLVVEGGVSRLHPPNGPIFIGNSGTSVRFLAAVAALVPGSVTLQGDEAMARRPISDLVDGLKQLGVPIDCPTGCPPLTLHGGRLPAGRVRMRGDRSSQYFSALMLAGSGAEGDLEIEVEGRLVSRPYVEITRSMVKAFGGQVDENERSFVVKRARLEGSAYRIEPDASSASYPFAIALATGGSITVSGLSAPALQGDYDFVRVLELAGATVESQASGTTVTGSSSIRGIDVDMHDISDTVMTLAAIAPLADGPTRIRNVANIRLKETDRLAALATELERLGQGVAVTADSIQIEPRPLQPAEVNCYRDHRIAMSFAVLGMATGAVTIQDPACVAKTYPGFWDDLRATYLTAGAEAPW